MCLLTVAFIFGQVLVLRLSGNFGLEMKKSDEGDFKLKKTVEIDNRNIELKHKKMEGLNESFLAENYKNGSDC